MRAEFLGTVKTVKLNTVFKRAGAKYRTILLDRSQDLTIEGVRVNGEMEVTLTGKRSHVFSLKTEACVNNGNAGKVKIIKVKIRNRDFETYEESCREEIEALACSSEARTSIAEIIAQNDFPMNEDTIVGLIHALYIDSLLERGAKERAMSLMFGDTSFTPGSNVPGRRNGIAASDTNYPYFEKTHSEQDGVWSDILNSISGTNPFKAQYFDTNDGTSGGNILNPANTLGMIRGLISMFTPEMHEAPEDTRIYVDPYILEAMKEAYLLGVRNGTTEGVVMQDKFNKNKSYIEYGGFTFRPFMESYLFGVEAKSTQDSLIPGLGAIKHEKNCRILVSLVKNMGITTTAKSITEAEDVALKIHPSFESRKDGITVIKGNANWGSGVIDLEQTIAGYAQSDSFI